MEDNKILEKDCQLEVCKDGKCRSLNDIIEDKDYCDSLIEDLCKILED